MIINTKKFTDYFIMVLFIGFSGVPYLVSPKLNILQMIILIPIFILRKRTLNKSFLFLFIILFSVTLLQGLKFDFFPIMTNIGLYMLVLSAYLTVKILDNNFVKYYINVMYYISLISLPIFFSILFIPAIGSFLVYNIVPLFKTLDFAHSVHESIIIYNLTHIDIFRNSGPFWEPGAYAGYLLLAFMLNTVRYKKLSERKNIVLAFTIFTTFSTTAYLALFLFLFFLYFKLIKNIILKIVAASLMIFITFFAITSLDFIGGKITERLEALKDRKVMHDRRNTGRFITILRDIKDFEGHEYVGRGRHNQTRFDNTHQKHILRSVGLTDIIVKYGLPFFIVLLYYMYRSLYSYLNYEGIYKNSRFLALGIIFTLMLTLISETYFNYSIYWSLLFLGYPYLKEKEFGI